MTFVTAPRVALLIAFALVVAVSGCSQPPRAQQAPAAPSSAPSPPAPDPATVCVDQLAYWAAEDLRGQDSEGYDYQHRGLTAQQADALRAIVAEAQGLGPDRTASIVAERIRAACERITGTPGR